MSTMLEVLKDYSKRGSYDEVWTPPEALEVLIQYLPTDKKLWDCAPGSGVLIAHLTAGGYNVAEWDGDFLIDEPPSYDIIVTNPPFSLAGKFLRRANELGKPWCMLLPITKLGAAVCRAELSGVEVIFPSRRIDFTGKKAPWFYSAWYTMDLEIGTQLVF